MADIIINPVAAHPRVFTWPGPRPDGSNWPGTKTNIWVDVYWSLSLPGTYKWQRTTDGVEWVEHGVPWTVREGQVYSASDSVDQFPNPPHEVTWKRIVKTA